MIILLLGIFLHAHFSQCCLSGRYGRYENWPTNSDWDELLVLLTGKYGNQGWGWQSPNSYAYNSFGDYPYGSSNGGGYGSSYSPGSTSGLSSKPSLGSGGASFNSQKMKEALESYFNSNKNKPIGSNYGGPSHYDTSSFNENDNNHYQYDSPPPTPAFSSGYSGDSWGGGSPPEESYDAPSISAHTKNVGFGQFGNNNNNQFQSDVDTFSGYGEKTEDYPNRRRYLPNRRRLALRPGRFNQNRRRNRRRQRMLETTEQISRRKLNTRFGGYKVDHSKLRA
ncbi:unnamed protein product [Orchesella dallaii]|uniref:Uncharacterized protein n=1 Tax=Orchesella dallaii TaxID=48710 RepID=A0ABP1PXA8_9HEXA